MPLKNANSHKQPEDYFPPKDRKLLELSHAVANELGKNYHPHTTVVIQSGHVWVEETMMGMVIDDDYDIAVE